MIITVIGSTKRHYFLAEKLKADGNNVFLFETADQLPKKISGQVVVLPIPTSTKTGVLNIEKNVNSITASEIVGRTDKSAIIISCNFSSEERKTVDINKYEPFCSMNAVPSAEGAILKALQATNITLYNSKTLVIGYGRIGKIIADRLKGFGADVFITARNHKDICLAQSLGHRFIDYSSLKQKINQFDFIFQTVPHLILTDELIDHLKEKSVTVELASNGMGTDLDYAKSKGTNVIYAPTIPEKCFPETAGQIFYDNVIGIIKELDI